MQPVYAIPVSGQQTAYPVFDSNASNNLPVEAQSNMSGVYPIIPETTAQQPMNGYDVPSPTQGIQPNPNVPPTPLYPPPMNSGPVVIPQQDAVSPQSGNILLTPDAHFFQAVPQEMVSPYPVPQQPKGTSIKLRIDTDEEKLKQKSALAGVGIGLAATIFTGGLAVPIIAGVVAYNMIKKDGQSVYIAYPNSFVWELRSALAEEYNLKPELILLKRKDVIMDDNEQLKKYIKSNKNSAKIEMRISQSPVSGSNYYSPNGSVYPKSQTVTQMKKHK